MDLSKKENYRKNIVLTIAGSDPSGGAGIQADLKAFASCGVYGASVITCMTAQNTKGVFKVESLSEEIIGAQLDAVLDDLKPQVIKTGMLYSTQIVGLVAKRLREYKNAQATLDQIKIIVDPVMSATTGKGLVRAETNGTTNNSVHHFITALKEELFPIAMVITPNLFEASSILGWEIKTREDMISGCKELFNFGPKYVLLKGGHLITPEYKSDDPKNNTNSNPNSDPNINPNNIDQNMVVDILYDGEVQVFEAERINKDVHGTGCTFASLLAGYIAKNYSMVDAIEQAKRLVTWGIKNSLNIGDGVEVVNLSLDIEKKLEKNLEKKLEKNQEQTSKKTDIKIKVTSAANQLTKLLRPYFVPEVGINIGYALYGAKTTNDICALTGRLVRVGEQVDYLGSAQFGASKHIARIILAATKFDKEKRCAMNIKYRPEIIEKCRELGFSIGSFDRTEEPQKEDSSSMEWGTKNAIESLGYVPDVIFDLGGVGKEPMIRLLDKTPQAVIDKIRNIIETFN